MRRDSQHGWGVGGVDEERMPLTRPAQLRHVSMRAVSPVRARAFDSGRKHVIVGLILEGGLIPSQFNGEHSTIQSKLQEFHGWGMVCVQVHYTDAAIGATCRPKLRPFC